MGFNVNNNQCKTCKTYQPSTEYGDGNGYCATLNDGFHNTYANTGLLSWNGNDLVYGELLVKSNFGCIFHTERG